MIYLRLITIKYNQQHCFDKFSTNEIERVIGLNVYYYTSKDVGCLRNCINLSPPLTNFAV